MNQKKRKPMQVSPNFHDDVGNLKRDMEHIRKKDMTILELTEEMHEKKIMELIKKELINQDNKFPVKFD